MNTILIADSPSLPHANRAVEPSGVVRRPVSTTKADDPHPFSASVAMGRLVTRVIADVNDEIRRDAAARLAQLRNETESRD